MIMELEFATSLLYESIVKKFPDLHKQGIKKPTMFDISDCTVKCEITNDVIKFDRVYYQKYDTIQLKGESEKIFLTKFIADDIFEYKVIGDKKFDDAKYVSLYVANYAPISDEIVQELYSMWIHNLKPIGLMTSVIGKQRLPLK